MKETTIRFTSAEIFTLLKAETARRLGKKTTDLSFRMDDIITGEGEETNLAGMDILVRER